jgi:flagellin-like protein
MFRSICDDKRGVSEIVGSFVMILIVVIAGTFLYSYSVNAFSSTESSYQLQTEGREEASRERFTIIAIWWDTSTQLNLTILNYGKIDVTIDAVYIDGIAVTVFESGTGQIMLRKEKQSIIFTSPITLTPGQTYELAAVSERGSKTEVHWNA